MAKSIFNHPVTKKAGLWGGGRDLLVSPTGRKYSPLSFMIWMTSQTEKYFLVFGKKENKLLAALCKKNKSEDADASRNFPLLDQSPETVITLQHIN